MNLTQLVEQLHAIAEHLPKGMDSEVNVGICPDVVGLDEISTNYLQVTTLDHEGTGLEVYLLGHSHFEQCPQPCDMVTRVSPVLLQH